MAGNPKFTSIRLTAETASKLRILTADLKAAEPETIKTTDDVVARLIARVGYREGAAAAIDAALAGWQGRLSDAVADEVKEAHARIGVHVVRASSELRQLLEKAREEE